MKEEAWLMQVDDIVRKEFGKNTNGSPFPDSWTSFLKEIGSAEYIAAKADYIASEKDLLNRGVSSAIQH